MPPTVSATIVTYNADRYITRCLASIQSQTYPISEIVVVDNDSRDSTRELVAQFPNVKLLCRSDNSGYCVAQNQAIHATTADWVLCINPDTALEPDCVENLVQAGEIHPKIGIVCPKILRMKPDGRALDPPVFDSTGAYFTPSLRHFDRGSQLLDYGQYNQPEYVFGYTGAIVLFRHTLIDDVSVDGILLDNDFYFYREDADLSWRAQLLGWKCLYVPKALGYHVRRVLPYNRRSLPRLINLHSTKNRFLLRLNNITAGVYRTAFLQSTIRDWGILLYVLTVEQSSLAGLLWVLRNLRRLNAKRRKIQARRRVDDEYLKYWFKDEPTSIPLERELYEQLAHSAQCVGTSSSKDAYDASTASAE